MNNRDEIAVSEADKSLSEFGKDADCYKCKHRGSLSYSAHSECKRFDDLETGKIIMTSKWRNMTVSANGETVRAIEANQHGIDNGWFFFPLDFDPVWLERCVFFEPED